MLKKVWVYVAICTHTFQPINIDVTWCNAVSIQLSPNYCVDGCSGIKCISQLTTYDPTCQDIKCLRNNFYNKLPCVPNLLQMASLAFLQSLMSSPVAFSRPLCQLLGLW